MAKQTLPVNFKDDIMNASMQNKRKYSLINNADGTVSLEDVTTYDQVGSNFGAGQINQTNTAVNSSADASKIIDSLDAIKANTQAGYMAGALALKSAAGKTLTATLTAGATSVTFTDPAITDDSLIDVYTDTYGVNPTDMTYDDATHTLTVTFDAQEADVRVKVRVM